MKNTADHLRNHGCSLLAGGWTLEPANDVNPYEQGRGLMLNITETDNSLDFDLDLSVAKYFCAQKDAESILKPASRSVAKWKKPMQKNMHCRLRN